eukprot:2891597-Prymnesium_polylepis.2
MEHVGVARVARCACAQDGARCGHPARGGPHEEGQVGGQAGRQEARRAARLSEGALRHVPAGRPCGSASPEAGPRCV